MNVGFGALSTYMIQEVELDSIRSSFAKVLGESGPRSIETANLDDEVRAAAEAVIQIEEATRDNDYKLKAN